MLAFNKAPWHSGKLLFRAWDWLRVNQSLSLSWFSRPYHQLYLFSLQSQIIRRVYSSLSPCPYCGLWNINNRFLSIYQFQRQIISWWCLQLCTFLFRCLSLSHYLSSEFISQKDPKLHFSKHSPNINLRSEIYLLKCIFLGSTLNLWIRILRGRPPE